MGINNDNLRGGTRGGIGLFRWEALDKDAFRINYLGNSVKAPNGRMTKEKDVLWYEKEKGVQIGRRPVDNDELQYIKQQEQDALNFALGTQPKTYENKIEKEQRKIARRERKDRKRILDLKETDVVNQIKIESETVELDVDTNDVKGSEEKRRRRNQSSPVRNERRMSKSPMKSVINDRHVRRERSAEKQRRDSRERSDRNGNQSRDERDGIRSKRSSRR